MIIFFLFFILAFKKKKPLQSFLSCKREENETLPKFLKLASVPLRTKKDSAAAAFRGEFSLGYKKFRD